MGSKFRSSVPKMPVFKRNMYDVPESYTEAYAERGIRDSDEQKALFYASQFGGFRLKKVPLYLKDCGDFLNTWFKADCQSGFFRLKANADFISEFGDINIKPLLRRRYSEKEYDRAFLEENGMCAGTARSIQILQEDLNDYYSSVRLDLAMPSSGIRCEDRMTLARFNSIPHLQYKPRSGGRLFHSGPGNSYQRISSSLRPFLTINGEETCEIDISAATVQFLNIVAGKRTNTPTIPKEALAQGDPYQYFLDRINSVGFRGGYDENGAMDRNSLKDLLYTLVYSPTNSQRRNVNRRLRLVGQGFSYSNLQSAFPDFFKLVDAVKSIPFDSDVEGNYPAHILIFQEESRYARKVLRESCFEMGFPVLPLHDSFIAPRKNVSELEDVMCAASMELYDYVLAHKRKF